MSIAITFLFFGAIPAIAAFILANVLARLWPEQSLRRRSMFAALLAGFLPSLLPLLVIVVGDYGDYRGTAIAALTGLSLITAILIVLPVAVLARRGKERADPPSRTFD